MNTSPATLSRVLVVIALLCAMSPTARAGEPDVRAGLRLPELNAERSDEQLSEAVFTSLTPFTIEEIPVRLPADQRLDNETVDRATEASPRRPNAR